ncbi:hypothetical protein BpHYR1_000443 [Brachionus plicatilis]|uniref:Uncharacterized protein n=1 Tax=Brachionus plicatilis TaxID=10195 RepID=A0A3M7PKX2_BRAPC|nr:hypothetical protein BpHYR1_000443 [Brachionus plicatilis]
MRFVNGLTPTVGSGIWNIESDCRLIYSTAMINCFYEISLFIFNLIFKVIKVVIERNEERSNH